MALETPPAGRGRGGGRGAPFGNSEPKRELRRPLASAPVNATPEALAQQIQNIDLKKSFNINAQEFVPTGAPTLSASANEFVPGQFETDAMEEEEQQHASLGILYEAMVQLTVEPGRFDSIARRLTEDLNMVLEDYDHLEKIAEVILENGITEPNFRYTGARLCDYLSLHLTVIIEGATLRQILMQKCNSLFKSRETLLGENPDRLRGFTMFLAELFQQLEIQVGAVVQRVSVLGDALPQLVCTLASKPNKENVRCLVQTLKCCGSVLEEEERSKPGGATPTMDRTMETLDRLADSKDLEEDGLEEMLRSLVRLRAAHWGHSPPGSAAVQEMPGSFQLDPTFYAPDGEVMTMEEYSFMEEMGASEEISMLGEGPVQWSTGESGGGMGDEAEAAYEDFLRQQN